MSPDPIRHRTISNPQSVSIFIPYRGENKEEKTESVLLNHDEYEALRLLDFEMLNRHQASSIMNVSKPTLIRIYASARQKIADALIIGKRIIIEGGKIYFDSEWHVCTSCGCYFNHPCKEVLLEACPLCGSPHFINYEHLPEEPIGSHVEYSNICLCPNCGFEMAHQTGRPCRGELCPNCNSAMIRKPATHNNLNE